MLDRSSAGLLEAAVTLLDAALDLIDRAQAPGHIGAHIDLARERLLQCLGEPATETGVTESD